MNKNKKTIKINFKYFPAMFDPENNLFTNCLRKNYKVIISDKPDYFFYSVYPEIIRKREIYKEGDFIRKISPRLYLFFRKLYVKLVSSRNSKMEIPKGNFITIFYGTEKTKPNMDRCDWAFSIFPEEEINNPRHLEILNHLINDFSFDKKIKLPWKRHLDFEKVKKEKTKFCNFIYSQEIPFRNKFFKQLNKYKKIDAPGRCMTNMKPITCKNPRGSRLSKNWAIDKLEFIKPYKFTIAFENTIESGHTTEKLIHPLLVNSIPIYMGNSLVSNYFNTRCFINYHDFNNMKEFIKHIIKVDNDDKLYRKYLEQPIFNTRKQYNFHNPKRIIDRLDEVIKSKSKNNKGL